MDILNWLKKVSRGPRPIPGLCSFTKIDFKKLLLLKKFMFNFMAEYGTAIITPKTAFFYITHKGIAAYRNNCAFSRFKVFGAKLTVF